MWVISCTNFYVNILKALDVLIGCETTVTAAGHRSALATKEGRIELRRKRMASQDRNSTDEGALYGTAID